MIGSRPGLSNGFTSLSRMALVGLAALLPVPAWGQSKFIRTPAESAAASRDWVPPSYYGFPLDVTNPTYFGGINSREDYAYGRGWGYANMMGYRMPINKYLPDKIPWFTSYPDTGEIYVRSGPPLKPAPPPFAGTGPALSPVDSVGRFTVEVPAEATVWIEDQQMSQTGATRSFVSPPLAPGKTYIYDVRARWQENGREMEQRQSITVQGGSSSAVRFPTAEPLPTPKEVTPDSSR